MSPLMYIFSSCRPNINPVLYSYNIISIYFDSTHQKQQKKNQDDFKIEVIIKLIWQSDTWHRNKWAFVEFMKQSNGVF